MWQRMEPERKKKTQIENKLRKVSSFSCNGRERCSTRPRLANIGRPSGRLHRIAVLRGREERQPALFASATAAITNLENCCMITSLSRGLEGREGLWASGATFLNLLWHAPFVASFLMRYSFSIIALHRLSPWGLKNT
ncbi:uncharacterized protein BDW70DRAFT_66116 [Aspergillus foveolatus]|uniref:uncharacterized protein n=1 Tax=Aspergillus foveolatus TaxID=210207 RepID=UPI003CCCEDA7